jgi:DNA ligase 1
MRFKALSDWFLALEKTQSRNLITEMLAELYHELELQEIRPATYLMLGQLGPVFHNPQFQLADKMAVRAVALAFRMESQEVWVRYKRMGDLGETVEEIKNQISHQSGGQAKIKDTDNNSKLSINDVYKALLRIAREGGHGSQERKIGGVAELLGELDGLSGKFVVRMVLGKLRLGFSDKTIMDALAVAKAGSKKARGEIEDAYQIFPDIGVIAQRVMKLGVHEVCEAVSVTPGVPIVAALCQRLKTADEMIAKMGRVLVEPKFDGTRIQIHFSRAKNGATSDKRQATNRENQKHLLKTFTRNLEETSHMFPELAGALDQIKAQEVILDGEAIGFDPRSGKLLPFQETITRKRKHGIEAAAGRVPLKFFVFDVLYKDGENLLNVPLAKRRQILEETIGRGSVIQVTECMVTDDPGELKEYHRKQLGQALEGVVVKKIDSEYEPGRRGWSWVKFKESETSQAKLSDTLDLAVMGFYRGKGRRTNFGVGAFLVGLLDEGVVKTVAKIGTGLTDEQWRELKRRLDDLVDSDPDPRYRVSKSLIPDVWVSPELVVEIAADEITRSPVHSSGFGLRFPRLVRFRDDKELAQVTGMAEMKQIT